jgi:AcrR family transcriptional regulator
MRETEEKTDRGRFLRMCVVKKATKHENKKKELVEIAEKLFLEKGYAETTVDDILAASGLSKGGFYHYFKSKEEVLTASLNELIEESLQAFCAIADDPALDALQKLKLFSTRKALFQRPKREYARYLGMLMRSDFTLYKTYVSLAQNFYEPFLRIVEQGVREGTFHVEYPRETAEILVRMKLSVPQSLLYDELLPGSEKFHAYALAQRTIVARALGVEVHQISELRIKDAENDSNGQRF